MNKDHIHLKLIDESSSPTKIPVSFISYNGDSFVVVKVITGKEYYQVFTLLPALTKKFYLHYGNPLQEGQVILQTNIFNPDDYLSLENIVSADLIIFGGGKGRSLKYRLKNVIYCN